jgi:hypothetical protein
MRLRVLFALTITLGIAMGVAAQGNPTGAIRGQVLDPDNLPLPGATVTVASPVLQGTREAVTSPNGDFLIPFLPPGEYTLTVSLAGFTNYQDDAARGCTVKTRNFLARSCPNRAQRPPRRAFQTSLGLALPTVPSLT